MNQIDVFLKEIDWASRPSQCKLFAVVDCAHLEHESNWRSLHAFNAELRQSLFEGTPDAGLGSVEPVLLDILHPSLGSLALWLVGREKEHPLVLWLASELPLKPLHAHLKSLLSVDLPGEPDAVLRFYDPRVFKKLMAVATPAQKARFNTHVATW